MDKDSEHPSDFTAMELAFFHTAGFGTVGGLLMGSR
jgi:hypothetical protein